MIIFVTIAIAVLIGFAGLSTDGGMIWITRSQLQNSVDAAVLAAAQELPATDAEMESDLEVIACQYATEKNGVTGMYGLLEDATCSGEADVTFLEGGNAIRVKAYRDVEPIFGQILGFQTVEVWAQATARVGSLGVSCLFPFFITEQVLEVNDEFYAPVVFTNANFSRAGNDDGGTIDVGGGADGVRDAMLNPTCADPDDPTDVGTIGDVVGTKPGDFQQYDAAWDDITTEAATSACPNKDVGTYLTDENGDGEYELDPAISLETCPRVVIIPVLKDGDYSGGSASGEIVGFTPFYFAMACQSNSPTDPTCVNPIAGQPRLTKADFWGYFIRLDATGLGYVEYDPSLGTKVVALAD